jgi:diacylglycerol kinase (ATP)
MSRLRVGLLINPVAAGGRARAAGRHVARLLSVAGLSTVDVSGPDARTAKARALAIRNDLTALVVVGGDGTVSLGAEIVAGSPVRLGLVPCGSGNDIARGLGIPIDRPDDAVRHMLHALSRPAVQIDAIQISSLPEARVPHLSLSVGTVNLGFDALVNARANRSGAGSRHRYVSAVVRELASFRALPYWIEVEDGPREEFDAAIVALGNGQYIGSGMRLIPSARVDDGLIDMATVDAMSRARLMRLFPRVFTGSHTGLDEFKVRTLRSVTVGLRSTRRLLAYADGEARAELPLRFDLLPGAVRVLAQPTTDALGAR